MHHVFGVFPSSGLALGLRSDWITGLTQGWPKSRTRRFLKCVSVKWSGCVCEFGTHSVFGVFFSSGLALGLRSDWITGLTQSWPELLTLWFMSKINTRHVVNETYACCNTRLMFYPNNTWLRFLGAALIWHPDYMYRFVKSCCNSKREVWSTSNTCDQKPVLPLVQNYHAPNIILRL